MPFELVLLSGAAHLLTAAFAYACHTAVVLFDSSPTVAAIDSPFFRWDAFHFAHIADHGYVYEYEWAFFPGVPSVLRILSSSSGSDHLSFLFHALALLPISMFSALTLYELSSLVLGSPKLARLATLLSLLPSSPITLRLAPSPEGWYTCAAYRGMLHCARKEWLRAALWFMIAGSFRSNGIVLAGFILWGMLVEPFLLQKKISLANLCKSIPLVGMVFAPFIYHHCNAYLAFCLSADVSAPEWCSRTIPSIYSYVQAKYWNVGLFKYWTLQQLPNFILPAPVLLILFSFSFWYLRNLCPDRRAVERRPSSPSSSNFLTLKLVPHVIHTCFMGVTLLVASHTQIALRLAASMPTIYWAAAWLHCHKPTHSLARLWVWWSFLWGSISIILWTAFLPPA
ncbi:ER membrane glycoprotein subunit of the GPI transamidase complex-like protein [Pleurotus ostreatus]|uniref:GPI mannosyltransferase 2 n=1 Tax=Pleurotus ostreatus TaxID=5322 RepID=A0A8H6ZU91_PLEOS|nr:ER membrane glycoprotein subunit of the GPI transamidase complex-like protein [Pleurotus ostreatus]KAF7428396.1 ER membrane glycoprotein subunit of the GPI transamidase complex-like protein [Pleurotus ostreatus]